MEGKTTLHWAYLCEYAIGIIEMEIRNPEAKSRMQIETEVLPSRAQNAFTKLDICIQKAPAMGNLCVKTYGLCYLLAAKREKENNIGIVPKK